jgi:hypothetical protein
MRATPSQRCEQLDEQLPMIEAKRATLLELYLSNDLDRQTYRRQHTALGVQADRLAQMRGLQHEILKRCWPASIALEAGSPVARLGSRKKRWRPHSSESTWRETTAEAGNSCWVFPSNSTMGLHMMLLLFLMMRFLSPSDVHSESPSQTAS